MNWNGALFDSIFYPFDKFLILRFFDALLIPVFPLILLGIFLGHKKITNSYAYKNFSAKFVNFLACGVPILFMLACSLSSFYLLFFFRSDVKLSLGAKYKEVLQSLESGVDIDSIISELCTWSISIGVTEIYLFDRPRAYWFVHQIMSCKENINDTYMQYEFINDYFNYFLYLAESEMLDTASPYSIYLPELTVEWKFLFDDLTISIFLVVSTITFLVILFAWVYMSQDERRPVFFFLLTIFAGFIIVLVASYNYLILFIGWEGVGLSSFLLINFWYTRAQANKAASKAVIVNRVGDIFLIAGLSLIYYNTNTLDFGLVAERLSLLNDSLLNEFILLFLFLAAVGKSAQLGLHTWLPDAMEGPTPVSALLHAATMVTAGIYLLLRTSFLFTICSVVPVVVSLFGLLTAFFAATSALLQYDLKKVIAYSTCSQLGYMIISVGLKQFNIAFFHLFNHAFFKALLFIAAGSVIHNLLNEQDIRKIGGLANISFFLFLSNSVGVAALAGSLFLSGFYSKDLILETSAASFTFNGLLVYWGAIVTAILTGIYSSDSLDDSFVEQANSRRRVTENIHPLSFFETFVLCVLVLFSLFSGYVFKDIFVGLGSPFLSSQSNVWSELYIDTLFVGVNNESSLILDAELLPPSIKVIPVLFSFLVGFPCFRSEQPAYRVRKVVLLMSHKWYFDILQNKYVVFNFFRLSYAVFWIWDKYLFEQFRFPKFFYK